MTFSQPGAPSPPCRYTPTTVDPRRVLDVITRCGKCVGPLGLVGGQVEAPFIRLVSVEAPFPVRGSPFSACGSPVSVHGSPIFCQKLGAYSTRVLDVITRCGKCVGPLGLVGGQVPLFTLNPRRDTARHGSPFSVGYFPWKPLFCPWKPLVCPWKPLFSRLFPDGKGPYSTRVLDVITRCGKCVGPLGLVGGQAPPQLSSVLLLSSLEFSDAEVYEP